MLIECPDPDGCGLLEETTDRMEAAESEVERLKVKIKELVEANQEELKNKIHKLIEDAHRENCTACTYVQFTCNFDKTASCRREALDRIIKRLHGLVNYIECSEAQG